MGQVNDEFLSSGTMSIEGCYDHSWLLYGSVEEEIVFHIYLNFYLKKDNLYDLNQTQFYYKELPIFFLFLKIIKNEVEDTGRELLLLEKKQWRNLESKHWLPLFQHW